MLRENAQFIQVVSCSSMDQYGEWLRASPIKSGSVMNKSASMGIPEGQRREDRGSLTPKVSVGNTPVLETEIVLPPISPGSGG